MSEIMKPQEYLAKSTGEILSGKWVREMRNYAEYYHQQMQKNAWVSVMSEIDKASFWSKCKMSNYCWEWQFKRNIDGYGVVRIGHKTYLAHRISFQLINGNIEDDICVLHKCDNPSCINPMHLFSGTHQDNMDDKKKKGRSRRTDKTSKYYGVGYRFDCNKWRAYHFFNKKTKSLGSFNTELEAAKARDEFIISNSMNEPLNFPTPPTEK